jgi:hypothetical protein
MWAPTDRHRQTAELAVAAETGLPNLMRDHDDRGGICCRVALHEGPSEHRRHAKCVKHSGIDVADFDLVWLTTLEQNCAASVEALNGFEDTGQRSESCNRVATV